MGKKIGILQSSYIPWKGYFDLINLVDEFILFDDMQYTRRDWRNRNKIKSSKGPIWLTIPVEVKGKFIQKIKDTVISDMTWNKKHWETIRSFYSQARFFKEYRVFFEELYLGTDERLLSAVNYRFYCAICDMLNIRTKLSWSMDYTLTDGKTERLVDLCKQAGGTEYISGPGGKNYIDQTVFEQENIKLTFQDVLDYPEYNQLFPPFDHHVSIIDLILNEGPNAPTFMKSF